MRKDKTPSIYLYNLDKKSEQVSEQVGEQVGEQVKVSDFNSLKGISEQVSEPASGQYKKEILKTIYIYI